MRRDEKKINKILSKVGDDEDGEEFKFDPIELRLKREAALGSAMTKPIFKKSRTLLETTSNKAEQYPFVFDGMSQSKLAAGTSAF